MGVSQLLGRAGRVQRIAEGDEAGQPRPAPSGREKPAAPRCVAIRPPIDLPPSSRRATGAAWRGHRPVCHGGKARLEHRRAVGDLAALVDVGEVERDDVDAARGQTGRHRRHERMMLPGPGAVGQHQESRPEETPVVPEAA